MAILQTGTHPVPRGQSQQLWQALSAVIDQLRSEGTGLEHGRVTVLDCGGGSGSLAVPLAGLGADVTVVDVSVDALSTLLRRAEDAGVAGQVHAVQGDAESLSDAVPVRRYGLVIAHDVLSSVTDQVTALTQLIAAVEPSGMLSLVNGNPVSTVLARALAGDALGAVAALSGDADRVQLDSLIQGCREGGLVVESVTGLGVFTELVSGRHLDGVNARADFAELEAATSELSPYRDIAARIHLLARRPAAGSD